MLPPISPRKNPEVLLPITPRSRVEKTNNHDECCMIPHKVEESRHTPGSPKQDKTMRRRPMRLQDDAFSPRRHLFANTLASDPDSQIKSPSQARRQSEGAQLTPRKPSTPRKHRPPGPVKPRFDELTLRQWFTMMDSGRHGHVTKMDWLALLRNNLKLKHLILHGHCDIPRGKSYLETAEGAQKRKEEAAELRKLLKGWREMDRNSNGTLEWEEFVSFFRQQGLLLEYKEVNHPTARISNILGKMHENGDTGCGLDEKTFREFEGLVRGHTQGPRRRSLEGTALQLKPSDKQDTSAHFRAEDAGPAGERSGRQKTPRHISFEFTG
mmetsp:Transcript_157048/g.277282  ORF Transcript_157048/g.277282 Transcript_157048/m.277282 type:complete len:325 (+) Transcript_157048:66-1040(+)